MGKWKHRLSAVDRQEMSAVCDFCGPVEIRNINGGKAVRCATAIADELETRRLGGGLTRDEYEVKYAERNGKCDICGTWQAKLHSDHCHKSGVYRGLLCFNCNVAIGHLGDDVAVILRAAEYVRSTTPGDQLELFSA